MRKFSKGIAATIVLSSVLAPSAFAAESTSTVTTSTSTATSFSDLGQAGFWATDSITQAQQLGLITGYEDNTYRPLETVTREQMAAILTRVLHLETPAVSASSFSDVKTDSWSHNYIEAVKKADLMIGDENGKFAPQDLITRQQLAAVLVRAVNAKTEGKGANLTVADKNTVSDWAKDYVQTAIELGLLKGDGTNFNPQNHALRQEIAVTALRLNDVVAKKQPTISNVHVESSNADNTKAMAGDTLTLTFTSDQPVTKLSNFKLNGSNPDTFTELGNGVYKVTHLVDAGDKVGDTVTFQINVKNAAGIFSQTIEQTNDASSVSIIEKQPRITNVHVESSNADHTKAVAGDTITLTFTSDEAVTKLGNFKLNGSNPDTFTALENGVYKVTHLVDAGDKVGDTVTFQINVKNAAGIYSPTIEQTSDASSVVISAATAQ